MFELRLASHLKKSLSEIRQLSSEEISLWMVYSRLHGLEDSWQQTGLICSVVANSAFGSKGRFKPLDFMPVKAPTNEDNPEQQLKMLGF